MAIPAAVCPLCAGIVPEEQFMAHIKEHKPVESNESAARELDNGHSWE